MWRVTAVVKHKSLLAVGIAYSSTGISNALKYGRKMRKECSYSTYRMHEVRGRGERGTGQGKEWKWWWWACDLPAIHLVDTIRTVIHSYAKQINAVQPDPMSFNSTYVRHVRSCNICLV